jgi:hypothetical protein
LYDFVKEASTKVFLSLFLREIMATDAEKENIAKQLLAKVERKVCSPRMHSLHASR